jgi:hypothetical protein
MKKFIMLAAFLLYWVTLTVAQNESSQTIQNLDPLALSQGVSGNVVHHQTGDKNMGDILSQISPTSMHAWGVAFDGQFLYFTDPYQTGNDQHTIYQYDLNGNPTGYTISANFGGPAWIADMACDGNTIYCCNVSGNNAINSFDIATGTLQNTITGDWAFESQRGLAFDAAHNEFYIGGWNSDKIWRVDASTGVTISEFAFENVSGLAWNPFGGPTGNGSLWVAGNTVDDLVTEIDPNNGWAVIQNYIIPNGVDYSSAGLEVDNSGNLWTVNQSNEIVYLIDTDSAPPAPTIPVSNWAIILTLMLISGFILIRYTNFRI